MSNEFYDHLTAPVTGSPLSSAIIRAEFAKVEQGFDKLPNLSTSANKQLRVNATGTAVEATDQAAINGGTIDGATIGAVTPAPGTFTTIAATTALTAPTKTVDTNTTDVATTAFVAGQASSVAPNMDGAAAAGSSLRYARQDHVHPSDTSRAPLASPTFTGTVTLAQDPTLPLQAATKQYVDAVAIGIDTHTACAVASTANLTLSGLQTIDGYTTIAGDRVLVKDQTTNTQNGIYVAAAGAWSRATDADATGELKQGSYVFVNNGTTQAKTGWTQQTSGTITIGTTPILWAQFSSSQSYSAGTGLTLAGGVFSVATVPVANGGTGATTAATAPFALKGGNSDITSLSGLTTPLSVAQGGTGANSLTSGAILVGNGTATVGAATGAQIAAALGSTNVTNASNVAVTDDTTTNATMYPLWTTAASGNLAHKVSSTKMSFNPSTGVLSASGFAGTLTGSATSAGTATTAAHVAGGVAGAVHYQSGVGATAFSAAGVAGQPLLSGGAGAPTFGTLTVANGGTGATTAAGAQASLDVPSRAGGGASGTWGINITGSAGSAATAGTASNVSGVIAVANGGTGATSLTGLVKGNGTGAMTAASSSDVTNTIGAGVYLPASNPTAGAKLAVSAATYPTLELYAAASPANQKYARMNFDAGTFRLEFVNDAYSAVTSSPLTIDTGSNATFSTPGSSIVTSYGNSGYGAFYAKGSGTSYSYMFFGNAGGEKGRITCTDDGTITLSNTTSVTQRLQLNAVGDIGFGCTVATPSGFARFLAIGDGDSGIGQMADGKIAIASNNRTHTIFRSDGHIESNCTGGEIDFFIGPQTNAGYVYGNANLIGFYSGTSGGNLALSKQAGVKAVTLDSGSQSTGYINRFGFTDTLTGSAGYVGTSVRNTAASGALTVGTYLDAQNENGIPVSSIQTAINTDGSSELRLYTTAAGSRTADRRNTAGLRLDGNNNITINQSIYMDNNRAIFMRDSGGTQRAVLNVGADNYMNLWNAGNAGVRVLNQAGSQVLFQIGTGGEVMPMADPGAAGQVLKSQGAGSPAVWGAASSGGGHQFITSSTTFTIPAGVTQLKLTVIGSGGPGGAGGSGASYNASGTPGGGGGGGGGGGAGGLAVKYLSGLTGGNTLSVTVGTNGGASIVASGTQSISTITANGGAAGSSGAAATAATGVSGGAGGAGGTATGGDFNYKGTNGTAGVAGLTAAYHVYGDGGDAGSGGVSGLLYSQNDIAVGGLGGTNGAYGSTNGQSGYTGAASQYGCGGAGGGGGEGGSSVTYTAGAGGAAGSLASGLVLIEW